MMRDLLPVGVWKEMGTFDDMVYAFDDDKTIRYHIFTDALQDNDFELIYKRSSENLSLGQLQSARVKGYSITDNGDSDEDNGLGEDGKFDDQDSSGVRLASLRDFPSLIALERMFYVAAERKAAPAQQYLDETTPHLYMAPDGSNVLNVLWKNRDNNCIERVQVLMDEVLDGGRLKIYDSGDQLVLRINSVDDGTFFQPGNVGYGFSYILSLLTTVVMASEGSFIIIENPEAHLHPSAQAKVMNVLIDAALQRDIQLIVETHSDHVLNTALRAVNEKRLPVEEFEVLFFKSLSDEGKSSVTVQNLEVNSLGHILHPPVNFFEQYSIDLNALYTQSFARHDEENNNLRSF